MIERPTARYGPQRLTRRARRWGAIGLLAVVLAAGVAIAIVAKQRLGSGDLEGKLGAYEIVDDRTASVTISVTREDPSRPVVCIVRARSIDGSETGRREVLVPPSSQTTVQVTADVSTSKPPVVGDIYGCGEDIPPYLVAP